MSSKMLSRESFRFHPEPNNENFLRDSKCQGRSAGGQTSPRGGRSHLKVIFQNFIQRRNNAAFRHKELELCAVPGQNTASQLLSVGWLARCARKQSDFKGQTG